MIKQNKHYPKAMKRMDGTAWTVTPFQDYLTPTPGASLITSPSDDTVPLPLSSALMLCGADFLVVIVFLSGWPPPRESLCLAYPLSSATRARRGTRWALMFHLTNGWVRFPCGSCGIIGPRG